MSKHERNFEGSLTKEQEALLERLRNSRPNESLLSSTLSQKFIMRLEAGWDRRKKKYKSDQAKSSGFGV